MHMFLVFLHAVRQLAHALTYFTTPNINNLQRYQITLVGLDRSLFPLNTRWIRAPPSQLDIESGKSSFENNVSLAPWSCSPF
jgi:hypothetical protein